MHSLPIQNGTQAPSFRLGDFDKSTRRPILVIPNADGAYRHGSYRPIPRLKFRGWREVHSLSMYLAPRDKTGLKNSSAFDLPSAIGDAQTCFRAKTSAALMGRLVFEYCSAGFARFFHAFNIAHYGLGTVTFHYCQSMEREVSMPTLFDFEAMDADDAERRNKKEAEESAARVAEFDSKWPATEVA